MNSIRTPHGVPPLLALACLLWAASASAEGGPPPAEVVLEAGEIDVRMQAGARVAVVHGRGERHPVSGEWARLDTTAGWAVEVSALVLARERDLRHVRISLDRIRRLVIEGPPSGEAAIDRPGSASKGMPRRELVGPKGSVCTCPGWQCCGIGRDLWSAGRL